MSKIIGIDLGTNSIGWALRNPDLTENQIEKFGVITFNKGVGVGKTGEFSYAAERTKKRSVRRLYQARKYRLWSTLEHLIQEGYCPLSIENLNRWRYYNKEEANKNNNGGRIYPIEDLSFDAWIKLDFNGDGKPDYSSPYQLRKELAETKLDLVDQVERFKLGRALYHIAQRRGFKSSRKVSDEPKEKAVTDENEVTDLQYSEKKRNKEISDLFEKYPQAQTIGWLFALLETDGTRIRENKAQYAIRENYKNEIKHIFQKQDLHVEHSLYQKLIETGKNKNDGAIFYKRPLRSQKGLIGKCTLEPNKYRAPVSHPDFETFRAWSFLNNIKYRKKNVKGLEWEQLDLDLKNKIHQKLFFRKKSYFPFSDIIDLVDKKGEFDFNYKPKTTVMGCPVSARLKDLFGEDYLNIKIPKELSFKKGKSFYDLEDIWHVLFSFEDQEYVVEFCENKLRLSPEQTKQFITAWNTLPVGYGMLSLNAIRKINKLLQKGLIYTEAVLLANLPRVIGEHNWNKNETVLISEIGNLIDENHFQKSILTIVNDLISQHKNLSDGEKFGYKDGQYKLDDSDIDAIDKSIVEHFGDTRWRNFDEDKRVLAKDTIKDCYQAYFTITGLERKDISGDRHLLVKTNNTIYYKADSGYYRLPRLVDTLSEFLHAHFEINELQLSQIYHPSEINIYPPAKPDKDGMLKLGSPKTGSFKNPMAMRALHELRKLLNYMIVTEQIDSDTRVVVEVARELNDTNKRWAIEAWQRRREAENDEFALAIEQLLNEEKGIKADSKNSNDIDKLRLWFEQSEEESVPPVAEGKKDMKGIRWTDNRRNSYKEIAAKKDMIDKYRLWKEQNCQCIYSGKIIKITDLFKENIVDFEHTIPRSVSFDNSLANRTVCYADYNRIVKKNNIPYNLNNYDSEFQGYTPILPRLEKWQERVERIKQQIDFWTTKSKQASDKSWKDDAIRQRHLWQMELDYWKNKLDRFTMKEVTSGFKNSQKVDTQLISKYAFHYLKTYFEKVDVQKGSITAEFRKIYGLQVPDVRKDRSKHSHHAKDAAVLTLIPVAAKRDEILKIYYQHAEQRKSFSTAPYKGFKREFVWSIDDTILINNIKNDQTLSPAKRVVRKRGKIQFIKDTNNPKFATGDCIRGQLHLETFFGAIKPAKRGEKGNILRDGEGRIIQEEEIKYVVRVPFEYKKDANSIGFKSLDEIERQIVDEGLKSQIRKQVEKAGGLKEAFENGIYMLNQSGERINKIRHIRIYSSVSNPLAIKKHANVSKHNYKHNYYASNGTNSYFAIYEDESKTTTERDYRNLLQVSQIMSTNKANKKEDLFEKIISKKKGKLYLELKLKYVLVPGTKVLFLKNLDEDVKQLSVNDLALRLYVFTNFESDGRLNFKFHMEAREEKEIKKENYKDSEMDFSNPRPTLRFSYSKYDFLTEEYDFKMNRDGSILWIQR